MLFNHFLLLSGTDQWLASWKWKWDCMVTFPAAVTLIAPVIDCVSKTAEALWHWDFIRWYKLSILQYTELSISLETFPSSKYHYKLHTCTEAIHHRVLVTFEAAFMLSFSSCSWLRGYFIYIPKSFHRMEVYFFYQVLVWYWYCLDKMISLCKLGLWTVLYWQWLHTLLIYYVYWHGSWVCQRISYFLLQMRESQYRRKPSRNGSTRT